MPAYTQTWYLNGEILGSAPCSFERTHAQLHSPRQYAFACPVCGEVWARRIITPSTPWFFWTICCEKCSAKNPNMLSLPGSVWLSYDQTYLDNLPLFILKHEAKLCISHSHP